MQQGGNGLFQIKQKVPHSDVLAWERGNVMGSVKERKKAPYKRVQGCYFISEP